MQAMQKKLPELIKRRIELSKIFSASTQNEKRKWGKIFFSGFEVTEDHLNSLALKMRYTQQKLKNNSLLWRNTENNLPECMFCYVDDPTKVQNVSSIFQLIKKYNPLFTYGIVRQFKEGIGVFDIFRFSKFTYLEHYNRVKVSIDYINKDRQTVIKTT